MEPGGREDRLGLDWCPGVRLRLYAPAGEHLEEGCVEGQTDARLGPRGQGGGVGCVWPGDP